MEWIPRELDQPLVESYQPTRAERGRVFREIRSLPGAQDGDPAVAHQVLSNGMTVGEFCLWYIASGLT